MNIESNRVRREPDEVIAQHSPCLATGRIRCRERSPEPPTRPRARVLFHDALDVRVATVSVFDG